MALRPVDLARAVGVSAQQIRNYEDAGVLPPVPRSESGYRQFSDRHRQALLTFRALMPGYGVVEARAIMRSVHQGDVAAALALVDAVHAEVNDQRRQLRETAAAVETIAAGSPAALEPAGPGLRVGELARRLGVRPSALRTWEAFGLLTPAREPGTSYRSYGPQDVRDAQLVHLLRQSRYGLPQVGQVLAELRRTGSTEALRAVLVQRREQLTARTLAMLDGAGRLHAYLTADQSPDASWAAAARPSRTASPALAQGVPAHGS
ncbi:MerR family transcriptional regulator [Jiangella anatolica]|uniref:MerR family transcriptional regulator n=1 Tax=Jiangella anatolica TaxID=2670374 RepID=A0A2W2BHC9_9ACTN|nr:MerR family transcriptional regulator [Jiangella anatolica]PZF85412.1 MerR family transcriptional regulator [Jiangella anatolica]